MKVFITGASGFIGGSVAAGLLAAGHQVTGLVRSQDNALKIRELGLTPLVGTLDDAALLRQAAGQADAVINAAHADHRDAAVTLLDALAGTGKTFIHTSGSSVVGTRSQGEVRDQVFDENTPFEPSPARAARAALNREILGYAAQQLRVVIICPSLIYGFGHGVNKNSMQIPWLIDLARETGAACHIGPGSNIWSNVHIDDLVDLYLLALDKAPSGAFYFAENGENSMREVCEAIGRMLGLHGQPRSMTVGEAAQHWGEGPANDTMGSNSRVRAVRARQELGWRPRAMPLLEEIERGCYSMMVG